MYTNRISRYPAIFVFALLLILSLGITYLIATNGMAVGPMVAVGLIGIASTVIIIRDYRAGVYMLFLMGVFMFYIDRIINLSFPLGTIYDALVALIFIALFINNKNKQDWTLFKNPVTIAFVVIIVYQILQFFNPAGSPVAWLVSLRGNISFLIYVICFQLFSSLRSVRNFTGVWVFTATAVALYGFFQEYVGLTDFENVWLYSKPERIDLYLIWGKLRKFSFLSDPSAFGIFMAASALACVPLAMGPFKPLKRIGYGVLIMLMLWSMTFSGTRTATAMVPIGVVFFIIMTIQNREAIIGAAILVVLGVVLLFGPFYGGTMSRLRSTFNPSEDPSMAVRDNKRVQLQEYIMDHPIGGGLYTVGRNGAKYAPGHALAGPWDPDSGYVLIALESGWVGLIIFQVLFFITMLKGIKGYFAIRDPVLKTYMLVYLVPFLTLSVAHFTQDAMFAKPVNLLVFATYALVIKLPSLEKKIFSSDLI